MGGILANVSTLLMLVGFPQSPATAGKGGRVRGIPRRPSIEAIRAVSSPQTKARGIPLENGPVHESARVSLVRIANDIFHLSLGIAGKLPFVSRGKPCSAPTSQAGAQHHIKQTFSRA